MDDAIMTFLVWDLGAAAVMAVLLGVVVLAQAIYRSLTAMVLRTRPRAAESLVVVRVPAPRMPEAAGSRR